MPQDPGPTPAWTLPADLATIVAEDGEWEDPSWDPILLTVIGDTRAEGRVIPIAWQLSLWPDDMFFRVLNTSVFAKGEKADGHAWSTLLQSALATRLPALAARLHDDSDVSTCVLWVETEPDGRSLIEAVWHHVHDLKAAQDRTVQGVLKI